MDENQNNSNHQLNMLYILIGIISLAVRQFCLPNPLDDTMTYIVINVVSEPMIHFLTMQLYHRFFLIDDCHPAFGSLAYITTRILITAFVYGALCIYMVF